MDGRLGSDIDIKERHMTTQSDYKTLKDGSIDSAHYIKRSHAIRSHDAHRALQVIWRWFKLPFEVKAFRLGSSKTPTPVNRIVSERHPLDRVPRREKSVRAGSRRPRIEQVKPHPRHRLHERLRQSPQSHFKHPDELPFQRENASDIQCFQNAKNATRRAGK